MTDNEVFHLATTQAAGRRVILCGVEGGLYRSIEKHKYRIAKNLSLSWVITDRPLCDACALLFLASEA